MKELTDFAEQEPVGARKSILLIMDEATAIVYFEKGAQEAVIDVDAELRLDYTLHLQKPGQCDDAQNCLCLFRSSEFETEGTDLFFIPKRVICSDINYDLEVETCSIGKPEEVNSYVCSGNNFMIERHLAKKSAPEVASYYELPRRTVLYFVKFEDRIRLIGDYGGQ